MEFTHVNFESSYFENCVFKNCHFISCDLSGLDAMETIFNKCIFLRSYFNNSVFSSCHFVNSRFEGGKSGPIGSAVLIDSKFSNFQKSIEFKGEVYFLDIFDQINELSLE